MKSLSLGRADGRGWMVPAAWIALPVVLVTYVLLRYSGDLAFAQALSQVVYLTPPVLAAAFSASAAWLTPQRSRARVVWILVATAASLLFASETYYSWALFDGRRTNGTVDVFFDVLNLSALAAIVAMLAITASIDRHGLRRATRLVLDAVVLLTFGFVTLFRFWVAGIQDTAPLGEAVRMTAYALAGLLIFGLNAYVYATTLHSRRRTWAKYLAAAIALFAAAMMLWSLSGLTGPVTGSADVLSGISSVVFLVGYYLVFIAGLSRVVTDDERSSAVITGSAHVLAPWPDVILSGLVLVSVAILGVAAFREDDGSASRLVYLASLTVATVCMVGRTALSALESDELRSRGLTDPVTGAANPRSFDHRIEQHFAGTRRFGELFVLVVLDLDDFAALNASMSLSAGDRVLTDVASAIGARLKERGRVFRLSSDEFAVLALVSGREAAQSMADEVLEAVRGVDAMAGHLTASVGFALCPDDALQRDALFRKADGALAWAKRHGKNRVIGYDRRVDRALGPAEQLRTVQEDARLDMARALVAATDARNPASYYHSRNVAALSCLLAEELGMDADHIRRIRMAAMLHDVGKIALPDEASAGRASQARGLIAAREHPELGERMLRSLGVEGVSSWVGAHHERWDGAGYPKGFSGEAIPVEARIMSLADAYDSMTGESRSGESISKAAALQEIDLGMGTRFDPALAEQFIVLVATTEALGWSDGWSAA